MKKFEVLVEETLLKMVKVEAVDETQALKIVEQMYDSGEIVLDSDNFAFVEIGYEINEIQ